MFEAGASNNMTIIIKWLPQIPEMWQMLKNLMKMDNDLIVKLINAFPSEGDYEALINSKGDEPVEDWDIPEQYFL
mgnify:CR=1 FL=1